MSMKEIEEAISSNSLPLSVAEKYLKLYIADINWSEHIAARWKNSMNKFSNETEAKDHIKRAVACATILPLVENTPIPDPPSNLLFWCTAWKQFYRDDWFKIFIDVLKEDLEISKNRNKIITLGIVEPIDIAPMTRQAYNWLYESAVSHDCINDSNREDIENKFKNIVKAYGGAVICNMFVNHKVFVNKVFNWRSGYFFEKQIHKVYTLDQICKIKSTEIAKINPKYIRKIENKIGA